MDKPEEKLLEDIKNISNETYDGLFKYSIQIKKCREILKEYKNNGGTQRKAYNTILELYKLYDEKNMENQYNFTGDILDIIVGYTGNKEMLIWEEYMKT
ncbi:MAG: hypothetical protein LBK58_07495 [Prevotellaceae bacterium]|nr:hypothetical protein [Prevotellaceae bacterium]